MPIFEYRCPDCTTTFEQLRPVVQADSAAACPSCHSTKPQRILSLFASSVKTNGSVADHAPAPISAGACCGGSCGCHH